MATKQRFAVDFVANTMRLRQGLHRALGDLKRFGGKVAKISGIGGLVGGASAAAGAVTGVSKAIGDLKEKVDLAADLGSDDLFAPEVFAEFGKSVGVAGEKLGEMVSEFRRAVGEGKGDLLKQIGMDPRAIEKGAGAMEIMRDALQAFAGLSRTDFLGKLGPILGDDVSRSLQKLNPITKKATGLVAKFWEEVRRKNLEKGLRVSPVDSPLLERFNRTAAQIAGDTSRPDISTKQAQEILNTFQRLGKVINNLFTRIVVLAAPAIAKVSTQLALWLSKTENVVQLNKAVIATINGIRDAVVFATDALKHAQDIWNRYIQMLEKARNLTSDALLVTLGPKFGQTGDPMDIINRGTSGPRAPTPSPIEHPAIIDLFERMLQGILGTEQNTKAAGGFK